MVGQDYIALLAAHPWFDVSYVAASPGSADNIDISAHCNRVPVTDGHTACVSMAFGRKKPDLAEVATICLTLGGSAKRSAFQDFRAGPGINNN
ncbi:MAG: hypothetical protein JEZ11_10345 [Desulfobacterales bacterium]|nr:hypothetical protein [Desulfobacterales bacterium]